MAGKIVRIDHPSRRRWTDEEVARLGREFDLRIARDLRIAPSTVAAERRRRGIAVFRGPVEWTDEALALLGTQSDASVALMMGIENSTVAKMRQKLGIAAAHPRNNHGPRPTSDTFWTPEKDALLGTASDAVIARRLAQSHRRVRSRRQGLGIPPAHPIPHYDWTKIDPLLGTEVDAGLARRFGMDTDTVRGRRLKLGIASHRPERRTIQRDVVLRALLEKPTVEIEEISASSAGNLRQELAIPAPRRRSRWTEEALARLGKDSDEKIAAELGLKVSTVRIKRCQRGLAKRRVRRRSTAVRKPVATSDDEKV